MIEPGKPLLEDMNEWKEKVVWPDINSWDWKGQRKTSELFLQANRELAITPWIFSGFFERMITLLDFENALIALIDEEQKNAVHEFLDQLADLYIALVDKYVEYFPEIDGFTIHDDWGSQRAPFFSLDTAMEMLVPHMKRVADYLHSKGLVYDMHSCGKVEQLVPAMIAIGVDSWSGQSMNDNAMLCRKYGKDILIGVNTPEITSDMSREKIRELAKEYVDAFGSSGNLGMISLESKIQSPEFVEYVYRFSREKAMK